MSDFVSWCRHLVPFFFMIKHDPTGGREQEQGHEPAEGTTTRHGAPPLPLDHLYTLPGCLVDSSYSA